MAENIVERVARIIDPEAWAILDKHFAHVADPDSATSRDRLDRPGEFAAPSRTKTREILAALREPSDAMWDGLARAIMMWLDMHPHTPRALFRHLELSGHPIPDWLRDEPEMKNLDHVPSKGTRCVIIWRAMLEAAITEGTEHDQG